MRISREDDGLRFIGEWTPTAGFVACDVECLRCGRRIDPHHQGAEIGLECVGCGATIKTFWSETELNVYMAEKWNQLRQACTHPTVTMHGSS